MAFNAVYPLLGPRVKSIFEYIKFEEEKIHLIPFSFDLLLFFGLPPNFNYFIDFLGEPAIENGTIVYPSETYGLAYTCDDACILTEIESIYNIGDVIAGPALWKAGSTKDNATGYALIYNPFTDSLVFTRYINQPLTNYSVILKKHLTIGLLTGQSIKIKVVGFGIFELYANDVLFSTAVDTAIPINQLCKGIAELRQSTTVLPAPPTPNSGEDEFDLHFVRRFYYCDNGIVITVPFIPIDTGTNSFQHNNDIALKSGENGDLCYGFYYAQGWTDVDFAGAAGRGSYIDFQFVYGGVISGQPISGITFAIDESKADPNDFTGYVFLVNERDGKLQLCYYENQSLSDLPDVSQIITEITKTLPAGSLVYADLYQPADDIEANWELNIWTQRPSESFVHDITHLNANELGLGAQLTDRRARTNYGLVHVSNAALGEHIARWNGTAISGNQYSDFE